MDVGRATVRDVLAGPDVVVVFVLLAAFSMITFLIRLQPIQTPGYLLAFSLGSGVVTVVVWYLIAVVAGAISRLLRTRFRKSEWDSLGAAVVPIATGIATVGVVVVGHGLRPMVLPIETGVTTCTPDGCISRTELITEPNLYAISIGIGLLIIGAVLLAFQSPRLVNGRNRTKS